MTRSLLTTLKGALSIGAIAGSLLCVAPAQAQVTVVVGPPPDFVATTDPVYYDGHADYWYNDQWYYYDGGAWQVYATEPGYLMDWRGHNAFGHHYYGRGHAGGYYRGGGRGGWGGGGRAGGGGHGGHR